MSAAAYESLAAFDLDLVRSADEDRAREAFDRLWRRTKGAGLAHLARRGIRGEEGEDVATEAYGELWRVRTTIQARELAQWYALVRMAIRTALRYRSRVRGHAPMEEDVPSDELPYLQAIVEAAEDRETVCRAADALWLGELPEPLDPKVATLAAQLALQDGMPVESVAAMLGTEPQAVEAWLGLPAVRARAAFASLCWDSDRLAAHLLRPGRPLSTPELDRLSSGDAKGVDIGSWDEDEALALCWHVRNALNSKEIVRRSGNRLDRDAVERLLERVSEAFPFRSIARVLIENGVGKELEDGKLWRRMAFEYHTFGELPYEQIEARTVPPAREAGYPLADSTIRSWLGNGRLWAGLASHLRGGGA